MVHNHDGTVGESNAAHPRYRNPLDQSWNFVQVSEEFRPPIKCKDPIHGNPITCDHDDIEPGVNDAPLGKDAESGLTPVKVIEGGPLVDNTPPPPEAEAA